MKTDDLIHVLGSNLEPVKGTELRNSLLIALAVGGIGALCLVFAVLGMPADVFGRQYLGFKLTALAFTLGLVATGGHLLVQAARGGGPSRKSLIVVGLLFVAMLATGIATLSLAHPASWAGMIFGPQWWVCLMCIPLVSIAPFASLILALRKAAPINLARTGAIVGLVAGALGAAAFALHHPGGSIAFIVVWYGGAIVLCTVLGAVLGSRLLRW